MWCIVRKYNLSGIIILAWKFTTVSTCEMTNKKLNSGNKIRLGLESLVRNYTSSNNYSSKETYVFDLNKKWSSYFNKNGISEPELSIRYIIEHVLSISQSYEYELIKNTKVSEDQEQRIQTLCECRLARMPVQYIIKEWDFRDLKLAMYPPVFIPRPETEQLVDLVIKAATPNAVFLEVGCGTGAISLSLLKALPHAQVIAIDQSKMAYELTKRNAQLNGLTENLQVVHSKLKEDGSFSEPLPTGQVDVLVSNPPYIPTAQMMDLQPEIKLYEDLRALEGGRDGLRVIKSLLQLATTILKDGGPIFMEVDSSHPKLIEKWLSDHPELNIKFVRTFKDFCDKDRFVELKKLE